MTGPQRGRYLTQAIMAGFCVAALVGCDGVRGASNYAKREAFSASFEQIPLIETGLAQDRALQMYVFTDNGYITENGVGVIRSGYPVRFSAAIDRR